MPRISVQDRPMSHFSAAFMPMLLSPFDKGSTTLIMEKYKSEICARTCFHLPQDESAVTP